MQVLFVVKNHRIAFWQFKRGQLSRRSLRGNDWNDYTPAYWCDWSAVNQSADVVDAILLSDQPVEKLGELPSWFLGSECQASSWKVDTLVKLANDCDFADAGIVICVRSARCEIVHRSWAENFWLYPSKGSLASALLELEAKRVAEVRRAEDEAGKKAIEEKKRKEEEARRATEARRIAEINRRNAETISAAKDRQQVTNAHPNGDVVQFWISRVGEKTKTAVCEILVNAVPRACKYPDWLRTQINDVARTGRHFCIDRELNAVVAEKILAEMRKVGADGYLRREQDVQSVENKVATEERQRKKEDSQRQNSLANQTVEEVRSPSLECNEQIVVGVWLSRVGSCKDTINRILVESLPIAKKYPDWVGREINDIDRIGQPVCFERKLDICVALEVLAKIRALGADGFLTGEDDFVLNSDGGVKGDVEVWLRRIGPKIETVRNILVESLPMASKFPDWTWSQLSSAASTGKALCIERKVDAAIAFNVLSKLRAIGTDGFTKRC